MPPISSPPAIDSVPLCVDLDGTLIRSDVLWESMLVLLKRNPLFMFAIPFWFLGNRANLKKQIAARAAINPAALPYHQPFLAFLRAEKQSGRTLVLATASDRQLADPISQHVGIFSEVFASDGKTNLRGKNKGHALAARYGERGFDYAGNSSVDLPVWEQSKHALVVNASDSLVERAKKCSSVSHTFNDHPSTLILLIKALRPQLWIKNLILFVPLLISHQRGDFALIKSTLIAAITFSFCASAVYVMNDLLDLEADRQHPTNQFRPFASGHLHLPYGFGLILGALALSAATAALLPPHFGITLAIYFFLTAIYSFRIKPVPFLNVLCLATLYSLRIVAGYAATRLPLSLSVLCCSFLIFVSLISLNRRSQPASSKEPAKGTLGGGNF